MWVTITRFSGLSGVTRVSSSDFHAPRVSFRGMPVSTIVQLSPSSISQRLMNLSEKGSGMLTHSIPGATCIVSASAGRTSPCG